MWYTSNMIDNSDGSENGLRLHSLSNYCLEPIEHSLVYKTATMEIVPTSDNDCSILDKVGIVLTIECDSTLSRPV